MYITYWKINILIIYVVKCNVGQFLSDVYYYIRSSRGLNLTQRMIKYATDLNEVYTAKCIRSLFIYERPHLSYRQLCSYVAKAHL